MKVLVSAFIGSDNMGDEAITQVMAGKLANDSRVSKLTLLSRNPEQTAKIVPPEATAVEFNFKNLVKQLYSNDCLVLGGGGIINDQSSVLSLLHYWRQAYIAKSIFRKPVFLLFVGVGPIKTRLGTRLLKSMGKLVDYSLVRDQESAELLKRHGFKVKNIAVAYDIVFSYPLKSVATKQPELPPTPYLLFCPRDWFFLRPLLPTKIALRLARKNPASQLYVFRKNLLRLVEFVLDSDPGLTVVGVPFYESQDLDLLLWMKGNLPASYAKRFIVKKGELPPDEFVALARSSAAIVGVRLHSLILGAIARRPLVALTYSSKVQNLVRYLGLESYTTPLDSPDFGVEKTAQDISRAIRNKPHYEESLGQKAQTNDTVLNTALATMAAYCRRKAKS